MLSILRKNVISNLTDTNGKPSHYILRVTATFSLSDDRLYIRHIKKTHHYVNDHFQEIYQADETLCCGYVGEIGDAYAQLDGRPTILTQSFLFNCFLAKLGLVHRMAVPYVY